MVQYCPHSDTRDYIHRVGWAARGAAGSGNALLFLRAEEAGFINQLQKAKVPLKEAEINWRKVLSVQQQLEKIVKTNRFLRLSAKEAFRSSMRAYSSHKKNSDVEQLGEHCRSFGFKTAPFTDIGVHSK